MNKISRTDFTLLVPVYNEEETVVNLIKSTKQSLDYIKCEGFSVKILFVNNASTDKTLAMIRKESQLDKSIEVISWIRNYGIGASVYNGLIQSNSKVTMVFDCDLQDPPNLISEFFDLWRQGNKFVYGVRIQRIESKLTGISRRLFRNLARFVGGNGSNKVESGTWLLDEKIIEDLAANPPTTDYLAGSLAYRKYNSVFIEYQRNERRVGISKFNFWSYLKYSVGGLLGDNLRLLRFSLALGLINLLIGSLLLLLAIIARYLLSIQIPMGLLSTLSLNYLFGSATLIALGLLGEYVGRIFLSTSRIPRAISED
jgi:glycosyltransferase involved in cell wall biosynthesis